MSILTSKNVGTIDRVLRFVLGVGVMGFTFMTPNPGEWIADAIDLMLGVFGFSLVLSAILAHCYVYQMFGISTCVSE
ncbi:MAG: DUF2892 domain-containing protein [Alphaproteobacteria bacterium]|nr:DUF2892 domain-containing protein [Alphaproteobacteria bacterium]